MWFSSQILCSICMALYLTNRSWIVKTLDPGIVIKKNQIMHQGFLRITPHVDNIWLQKMHSIFYKYNYTWKGKKKKLKLITSTRHKNTHSTTTRGYISKFSCWKFFVFFFCHEYSRLKKKIRNKKDYLCRNFP